MKPYSSEEHLSVFEIETNEERIENAIRNKNIFKYRCKTYKAGERLECEIFPLWNTRSEVRAAKTNKSRKSQENLNHWNRQKTIARYATENFTEGDYWGTVTYDKEHLPETPRQARRNIVNYLRRVERKYKKLGIKFKYICVTGGKRLHHHFIISGGADRNMLENMWKFGAVKNVRQIQNGVKGVTGIAFYISKPKNCVMRWGHSRNLKKPNQPKVADNKIGKHNAQKIAECEDVARAAFEKLYPDYEYEKITPKRSKYVSGVYLYVEMWKRKNNSSFGGLTRAGTHAREHYRGKKERGRV